jgi:hypothetical protein
MADRTPLLVIHSSGALQSGIGRISMTFWKSRPTQEIVDSLAPGQRKSLRVKPDGRIMNGNKRITVLIERGYPVDDLPREELS